MGDGELEAAPGGAGLGVGGGEEGGSGEDGGAEEGGRGQGRPELGLDDLNGSELGAQAAVPRRNQEAGDADLAAEAVPEGAVEATWGGGGRADGGAAGL